MVLMKLMILFFRITMKLRKARIKVKRDSSVNQDEHVCKHCNEEFSNESKLRKHWKVHRRKLSTSTTNSNYNYNNVDGKYICNTCDTEYVNIDDIKKHVEKHEERYKCDICDQLFKDPLKYCVHNYGHNKDTYRCPLCTKTTPIRKSIYSHIKRVHLREYLYNCQYCGKGFDDKTCFAEHEAMHKNGKKFSCIVCGKEYPFSKYLLQHQIRYHRVNIDGVLLPNECHICNKIFTKETTLSEHIKRHSQVASRELKHLCDICGKGFARSDKLNVHYRVHTGYKPYSCRFCDKSFTKKEYLTMHERIHSGEKPFTCQYCGKCFNQTAPLRIHIRGHTGEKPYVCHVCNTGFSSSAGLKSHYNRCNGKV